MEYLAVTLVQSNIYWEDPEKNILHVDELLHHSECGDLIILPEMFTTGFSTKPSKQIIDFAKNGILWMQHTARLKNAAVCGSMIAMENGRLLNRFVFADPSGKVFHYDKKHLFSMGTEDEFYAAGTEKVIIPFMGLNFRPNICYDLRFPVWNRNTYDPLTGKYEYDVLMFVANWPEQRIHHWEKLLQARAIENQAWVCGVNRVGTDENNIVYSGSTMLVDPYGEFKAKADDHTEQIITAQISITELVEIRKKLPFALDWDRFQIL